MSVSPIKRKTTQEVWEKLPVLFYRKIRANVKMILTGVFGLSVFFCSVGTIGTINLSVPKNDATKHSFGVQQCGRPSNAYKLTASK